MKEITRKDRTVEYKVVGGKDNFGYKILLDFFEQEIIDNPDTVFTAIDRYERDDSVKKD